MSSKTYVYSNSTPGQLSFTMPPGFEDTVEIHCWGAGGGRSRSGILGGAGGYASSTAIIAAGDFVEILIGSAAQDRQGGRGLVDGRFAGGTAGATGDEDGDTGWGGGGGAASAVLVNDIVLCVGAGGGGPGGYGDDSSGGFAGRAGGVYESIATSVYPVSGYRNWGSFINTYGVWGGGQDYSVVLNFPTTGTYTFNYSVDNNGSISLDGTPIISRSGEYNYSSTYTATATVSAGNHTIRVVGVNISGPAGVAAQILNPDNSELWNTRSLLFTSGLTTNTIGGSSGNGATSGGAGGGGWLGGAAGPTYGDDSGNAPPGNGGQNLGAISLPGDGSTPGGIFTLYYPKTSGGRPARTVAGPQQNGYVVLVFTKKLQILYKENSAWKDVTNLYYKANNENRAISQKFTTTLTDSGTFTVPAGVTSISVTALGGGGGGGGGHINCGNRGHRGGAGGGGQQFTRSLSVSEGQLLSYSVGIGGAGGGGEQNGAAGTDTQFGSIVALAGGGGTGGRKVGSPGTDYGGGNGGSQGQWKGGAGGAGGAGALTISYTQNYRISGWKQIIGAWIKEKGTWRALIGNRTIDAALLQTIRYDDPVVSTFTVPATVTSLNIRLLGGGGGGGGRDSAQGHPGYGGFLIQGNIAVTPGDVITIAPGRGGQGGADDARSGAGGAGGISPLTFDGGAGGSSGGSGISGAGGGGGAASAILINGDVAAVAAGGAGGGGGGNGPRGLPTQGYSNSGAFFGSAGTSKSGDGGGAGGGGGGFYGGAGGALVGGDSGAYSGSSGNSKIPATCTITQASNGGQPGIRGVQGAGAGGNGYIIISYYS